MYEGTEFYYDSKRLWGVGEKASATLKCSMPNYISFESYIGTVTGDEVVEYIVYLSTLLPSI